MMPTPWKEPPSVDLMEGERSPLAVKSLEVV